MLIFSAHHCSMFIWQVPALRAGVVSASRPRQAGMIIGVVPRYDPHGMVLPLPTVEQLEGRPRAASLSSENIQEVNSDNGESRLSSYFVCVTFRAFADVRSLGVTVYSSIQHLLYSFLANTQVAFQALFCYAFMGVI